MKTTLTKEQSQHLIKIGVPKEKASNRMITATTNELWYQFVLTDLLEILPKEIEAPIRHLGTINIFFLNILYYRPCRVSYKAEPYDYVLDVEYSEELIDALYKILCWIIQNGYLKYD